MADLNRPLMETEGDASYAGDATDLAEVTRKQQQFGGDGTGEAGGGPANPGNPFTKPALSGGGANPFTAMAASKFLKKKSRDIVLADIVRPSDVTYSPAELKALQHAGIYLREGEMYLKFDNHPSTPDQIQHSLFLHSAKYCGAELGFALLYMLLAIIEYPACFDDVPVWLPVSIELICLGFFVINLMLRAKASGSEFSFETHPGYAVRVVVVLLLVFDLVVTILYPQHPRFIRVLRPILVLDAELAAGVRRICRQIVETTYQVLDMLILVVLYILIWSVLGFYFFSDNDDDPYFRDLATSYVSLFILMTTANFPDVMMPAYYANQYACIFFIVYMLFGFYFLLNIVLAMVYEGFTDTEKRKFKKVWTHQRVAARKCFEMAMAGEPEGSDLNFAKFAKICHFYRDNMATKQIYLAYRALDRDFDGGISLAEFYHIFDVVNVDYSLDAFETFGTVTGPTRWHQRLPSPWPSFFRRLVKVVEHVMFEYLIDTVILINTIFVIVQAAQADYMASENYHTTNTEWVFFSIYVLEAICKIFAAGWKLYISETWNKFDFSVVFVSFLGIVIQETTTSAKSSQMTVFIRSLRLLRLIRIRQTFRSVVAGMGYMIPKMGRFLSALLMVYYIFAIIGMGVFNDTVSRCSPYSGISCYNHTIACTEVSAPCNFYRLDDNGDIAPWVGYNMTGVSNSGCGCCAPSGRDCGSEYAEPYLSTGAPHNNGAGYYQINNFDDIVRSYVTLFQQMIVNNWFVAMNGHVYMTSEYARIYFIIFFLLAVQVVTNIIVSFVIDSFMGVFPILKARKKGELAWSRAYNETVKIGMDEARKVLDADDLDLFQAVPQLVYCASNEITAGDIDRILFEDDITEWLQDEKDDANDNGDDGLAGLQ